MKKLSDKDSLWKQPKNSAKTVNVVRCDKNITCLSPSLVGIKALTAQSRYTLTYKHFLSKPGIQLAATQWKDFVAKSTTINET